MAEENKGKIRKLTAGLALCGLCLAGPLAIEKHTNTVYNYTGPIRDELVNSENGFLNHRITVKRDGKIISYVAGRDHRLNALYITENKKTIKYVWDVVGSPILMEAQKQYNGYLDEIVSAKTEQGLSAVAQ